MKSPWFSSKAFVVLLILVAPALSSAPPDSPEEQTTERSALDEPRGLIKEGDYVGAEVLAREMLQTAEAAHGKNSLEVAEVLNILVQALWRGGKVQAPETRALAERAVRIKEDVAGPDSLEMSNSLVELANVLHALGEYKEAIAVLERGLVIDEAHLGPEHPNIAIKLNNLGNAHASLGNSDEAISLAERSLAIREKASGPVDPAVATALHNLAEKLQWAERSEEAWPLYERALSIREEALGADHPQVASTLNSMGWLLFTKYEYKDAVSLFERALQIQEASLGLEHPDAGYTLFNLGIVAGQAGNSSDSIHYFERSLAIREKALGPDHWKVASALGNLALVVKNTGDLLRARQQLERALKIFENSQKDPTKTGWILRLLGAVQSDLGDYEEAKRYFARSVELYERHYGPEHQKLAGPLNSLAWALQESGESAAALETLERALAICEKAHGPGDRCAIAHLADMAEVMRDTGDLERAKSHFERALAIQDEVVEPGTMRTTGLLSSLAGLYVEMDRLTEARELSDRVLEIREQKLGPSHRSVGFALAAVAKLYVRQGDLNSAFDAALRAEQIGRDYMRTNARGLSEREALRFSSHRPRGLDVLLSAAALDPTPQRTKQALDSLIQSRALVLDEMAERRRVTATAVGDPDTVRLVQQYRSDSERLAYLTIRGPGGNPERHVQLLEEARRDREKAERVLGERSAGFRTGMSRSRANLADVRGALPGGGVLVAYVRYDHHPTRRPSEAGAPSDAPRDDSGNSAGKPVPSFAAFVLRKGEDAPILVRLGEAATIESFSTRWGQEAAHGAKAPGWSPAEAERAYRVAGNALREKIWDPVAPLLDDASIVFVVPDGTLHQIDLAALPMGNRKYLVEQGPLLHYLSAARDLVPVASPVAVGKGLLALGAPEFDGRPLLVAQTSGEEQESGLLEKIAALSPFRGERSGCGDFGALTFAPLPASREEVQEIAALWKQRGRDDNDAVVLTGAQASEAAFKAGAPGKRAVHVATHGFFLDGRCPSAVGRGTTRRAEEKPPPLSGENPLLLSGLALAGANRRAAAGEHEEDGIITAEEIAALDLTGVEWAVLSACDTGVGQVKAGEGIFGLRRAFRVAGVGTLIVSLWPVEDQAVQGWMSVLYRKRFIDGLSTAEAMRATSLEILRERREEKLSTHPSHWAGFVATGDWR